MARAEMSTRDSIKVEVCYALRDHQDIVRLTLPAGCTVQRALDVSGLLQKHLAKTNKLGIFAKLVKADTVLRDRDRIEIYRPLIADPKEVRRKRAEEGKLMKKGGGSAEEGAA